MRAALLDMEAIEEVERQLSDGTKFSISIANCDSQLFIALLIGFAFSKINDKRLAFRCPFIFQKICIHVRNCGVLLSFDRPRAV